MASPERPPHPSRTSAQRLAWSGGEAAAIASRARRGLKPSLKPQALARARTAGETPAPVHYPSLLQ